MHYIPNAVKVPISINPILFFCVLINNTHFFYIFQTRGLVFPTRHEGRSDDGDPSHQELDPFRRHGRTDRSACGSGKDRFQDREDGAYEHSRDGQIPQAR